MIQKLQPMLCVIFLALYCVYLTAALTCTDLEGTDQPNDVIQKCTTVETTKGYELNVGTVNKTDWDVFVKRVTNIQNVNVVIDGSTIEHLELSNIQRVDVKKLIIKNNLKLNKIHIKAKQHIDIQQLEITGNPQLQSIIVSTPKNFAGGIWIRDNGQLTSLDLDFSKMDGADFILENNLLLTTLKMDTITSITLSGDLKIENNPKLQTFTLGAATTFNVHKKASIVKNDQLWNINFGYMTAFLLPELTINQNRMLKVFGGDLAKLNQNTKLTVHGNQLLPDTFLNSMTNTAHDIQKLGECILPNAISDLSQLNDCQYVDGNLELAVGVKGKTTAALTEVTGTVELADVDPTSLKFLEKANTKGITTSQCDFKAPSYLTVTVTTTCPAKTTPPAGGATSPSPPTATPGAGGKSPGRRGGGTGSTPSSQQTGREIDWTQIAITCLICNCVSFPIVFFIVYPQRYPWLMLKDWIEKKRKNKTEGKKPTEQKKSTEKKKSMEKTGSAMKTSAAAKTKSLRPPSVKVVVPNLDREVSAAERSLSESDTQTSTISYSSDSTQDTEDSDVELIDVFSLPLQPADTITDVEREAANSGKILDPTVRRYYDGYNEYDGKPKKFNLGPIPDANDPRGANTVNAKKCIFVDMTSATLPPPPPAPT